MSPPTVADPGPRVATPSATAVPVAAHPVVSALTSALLLWSAFPPTDAGWLAWGALAPLFGLVRSRRSPWALYSSAWAGGMVFWLLAIQWVRLTDETAWLAWVVMALALSLWWPAALGLTRLAVRRLGWPLMLAGPVVWVALEYLRAYALTGFPWYYLAHTQHGQLAVIQIADLSGSLGVSFLVALINAWWVELLSSPLLRPTAKGPRPAPRQLLRASVAGAALAATLAYGGVRLATAQFRPGPKVALIQSDIVQRYKMGAEPAEIVNVYKDLIGRAVGRDLGPPGAPLPAGDAKPDLIVWPETSYPYGYIAIAPGLAPGALSEQVRQIGPDLKTTGWIEKARAIEAHLHDWTDALGVPMLVGTLTYDHRPSGMAKYNSAVLFQPGPRAVQSYHKIHLVPFGEYVPLVETLPWLVALTPYRGTKVPSLTFGHEPAWFQLGPYRMATAICFEDTVPHVVRRFFSEAEGGRQPDVLLNMSNDGWFHGSSEHDMHLFVSVFRAIENRVPLARAVNTGISALVDGNGRVVASLGKSRAGVLTRAVPLDDRRSLYTRLGDWPGLLCLAASCTLAPLALIRPAPSSRPS